MKNPLSLEALISWLRTKPADETYDWTRPKECLAGQFLKQTMGATAFEASLWKDSAGEVHAIPRHLRWVAFEYPGCRPVNSFGAALLRAEKLLAKERMAAQK